MARRHLLWPARSLTGLSALTSGLSLVHAQTQASPAGPDNRRFVSSSLPASCILVKTPNTFFPKPPRIT